VPEYIDEGLVWLEEKLGKKQTEVVRTTVDRSERV
jgi:hypothetical protein